MWYLCKLAVIWTWVPRNPSLGSIDWLEQLTELRKLTYHLPIYYKGYDEGSRWTSAWKRCMGPGMWQRAEGSHALSELTTLPSACVPHPESLPDFGDVYRGFLMEAWWVSSFFPSLTSLSGDWRWGWTFQTSNPGFGLLMISRQSGAIQEPTWSHLSRAKDTAVTQGILRNPVSGPRVRDPI